MHLLRQSGAVQRRVFDAAVAYAREGKGAVLKLPPETRAQLTDMLGPALPDRHNLTLMPIPRPDAGYGPPFWRGSMEARPKCFCSPSAA
jgi:hypothetical protein